MEWEDFRKAKLASFEKAVRAGSADKRIIPLLKRINASPSLITSSSCAGRIVLLETREGKSDASFFAKWHEQAGWDEFERSLAAYEGKKVLWLRSEPFILHLFARDLGSAGEFLQKARRAGVKRGGISQLTPRIFIEIIGTHGFALPVHEGKLLVQRGYLKKALSLANKNLIMNSMVLGKLLAGLSKS